MLQVLVVPEQVLLKQHSESKQKQTCLVNKQFFAAKGWLSDALDLWLGLRVSKDGVHFHPINDGKPFAVRGLAFRGKALDIEMSGMGTNARFSLNGEPLDGGFIPWAKLCEGRNRLVISLSGERK